MKNPTPADVSVREEPQLADYLVDRVCGRAAGRFEDECVRNAPRDKYFLGSLRPTPPDPPQDTRPRPGYLAELMSKLAPMAFGAEFRVRPLEGGARIDVRLAWSVYYRVFPTLDEQREYQRHVAPADMTRTVEDTRDGHADEDELDPLDGDSAEGADATDSPASPPPTRARSRGTSDSLFPKFRKIRCSAAGSISIIRKDESEGVRWDASAEALQAAVDREVARAQQAVAADDARIRVGPDPETRIRVPVDALDSEEKYAEFRRSLASEVVPPWAWNVAVQARESASAHETVLILEATNVSRIDSRSWHSEGFFFDPKATFQFQGAEVLPFELDLAPRGFRYDRELWGRGFNCGVVETRSDAAPPTFETTNSPVHEQRRYSTNTEPQAPFRDLATDPLPVLCRILAAMRQYEQETWVEQRERYSTADADWERLHGAEYDSDLRMFRAEADRFERGCEILASDSDACLAFQLMNASFADGGSKTAWRLFQVVFIVSQIPGTHALKSRNDAGTLDRGAVDIVYFPTGGGKTEAYLGTIVFHCFFDRLRGKSAGVTTWTRFPLRLLTLQQTQRVADVIGSADLIRRTHRDPRLSGADIDPFAVGYFVGQEATPNELKPPRRGEPPEPNWSIANDPSARQRWKRITRCPSCKTTRITVDFDADAVRVLHRCTESGCIFPGGVLPVHVVDNEVYRYLPTVIVGTIDKLAGLGNQRKLSMVLGNVSGRCARHGYYSAKCCQKECTDPRSLRPGAPKGISGPTLFVQDELHLLKEGLGTFDGHYETFLQTLLQEMGQTAPVKIVASSATIEAFERQVEHLYGRAARVFPGPGPTRSSSFYARTHEHPQRLFVGVLPHNKTIFNAILELLQLYHEEIAALARLPRGAPSPYGGVVAPGTDEWAALLDPYVTSLTYFSSTRELSSLRTDLESHTNSELERAGIASLRIAELSGSTSTDSVTRILDALEGAGPGDTSAPSAVLATSMISHGVDVDRFNCMVFYGMPKQNAEYIQSSSRVGRTHVGIVFVCLKPARERDQSHFAYFAKYHEFLGQLVEPVAINRWSKFSIQRTIPGLFMGVLLQQVANRSGQDNPNRYYMVDFVKKQISQGALRPEAFIPMLDESYRVGQAKGLGPAAFQAEIGLRVRQFFDQILGAGGHVTFVSEALVPKPMRSLRDVDEQIEIELDANGTDWARRATS